MPSRYACFLEVNPRIRLRSILRTTFCKIFLLSQYKRSPASFRALLIYHFLTNKSTYYSRSATTFLNILNLCENMVLPVGAVSLEIIP